MSKVLRTCQSCKKEFVIGQWRINNGHGKFCSKKCFYSHRNSIHYSERFWKYVEKTDTCWIWKGGRASENGYGMFQFDGTKTIGAHRVSYFLHFGEIPKGMLVLHQCDCRPCVRPDHLFLGTHEENMQDMVDKNRQDKGESRWNAKLTKDDIIYIRKMSPLISQKQLGQLFNVDRRIINSVLNYKMWKHC